MKHKTTRRSFLERSARSSATVAAASLLGGVHAFGAISPNVLRFGLIGCGGMMKGLTRHLCRGEKVAIAWLCDVDPRQMDKVAEFIPADCQPSPIKRTAWFEDVVGDDKVDACIIATPHHWHAPIALAAIESGKDVYIEKPISHVFDEGLQIISAAKKHGRVVQQGTQTRSSPVTAKARKLLDQGIIGEVKVARAWSAELEKQLIPEPDTEPPVGVDYDRWLGPAPSRPFNSLRFHKTWRKFRDYGNGEIGDDGVHDLDLAVWGLGVDTLPQQITARGGRMIREENASEYPDNMNVTYEFPDGRLVVYESLPFTPYGIHGYDSGNVFYGTEGYMVFSRRGAFNVYLGWKGEPGPTEGKELRGQRGNAQHMDEFVAAIRSRDPKIASHPELAHLGCGLVHLGEIASLAEKTLAFDPTAQRFVNSDEANRMLTKEYRDPYGLPSSQASS